MDYYNWIIVLHIMSFISWMAVLLYLPRLFVYHIENKDNEGFVKVVSVQEEKLYKYIGFPTFIATIFTGGLLLYFNLDLFRSGGWLHLKLTLVFLLAIYFFSLEYYRIDLKERSCNKSAKFFRIYNEIPTVLSFIIVIMVIIRPF